jgi:hypothetical protein
LCACLSFECAWWLYTLPQLHLVEIYADGKLTKRMRRADQKRERVHWRIVAAPQARGQMIQMTASTNSEFVMSSCIHRA